MLKKITPVFVTIVFVCSIIASMIFIMQVEAHYNIKYKTNVVEKCYLIGYPSRTLCRTKKYTVTTFSTFDSDHVFALNEDNVPIQKHKEGRANHSQTFVPRRTTKTKNVYSNCGECN